MHGKIAGTINTAHLVPTGDSQGLVGCCAGEAVGTVAPEIIGSVAPEIIGAKLVPARLNIRGRFWTKGGTLYAVAQLQGSGRPVTIRARVPLAPLAAALEARYPGWQTAPAFNARAAAEAIHPSGRLRESLDMAWQAEPGANVAGLWDEAKSFASSTAGKVVTATVAPAVTLTNAAMAVAESKIGRQAKALIRSKYTGAAVGILAVAWPPVGVPAAAAYAAANAYLEQAEQAQEAIDGYIKISQDALEKGKAAQKFIAQTQALAKKGDPEAKRIYQQLSIAKKSRDTMRNLAAKSQQERETFAGILVLKNGKLMWGDWHQQVKPSGIRPGTRRVAKPRVIPAKAPTLARRTVSPQRVAIETHVKAVTPIPTLTSAQKREYAAIKAARMGMIRGRDGRFAVPTLPNGARDTARYNALRTQGRAMLIAFNRRVYGVAGGAAELYRRREAQLKAAGALPGQSARTAPALRPAVAPAATRTAPALRA